LEFFEQLKVVLSMWPCKRNLHEEKLKHAGLAQQNSFGPVSDLANPVINDSDLGWMTL
jgi:hypothetical protein